MTKSHLPPAMIRAIRDLGTSIQLAEDFLAKMPSSQTGKIYARVVGCDTEDVEAVYIMMRFTDRPRLAVFIINGYADSREPRLEFDRYLTDLPVNFRFEAAKSIPSLIQSTVVYNEEYVQDIDLVSEEIQQAIAEAS